MDKLKFFLFSIISLGLLGLLGYWSVITLQSGTEFKTNEKIDALQKENEDLKAQIVDLTDKLDTFSQVDEVDPLPVAEETVEEPDKTPPPPTKTTTYKNQDLINKLQELINSKVSMKLKSAGTRVGTVQTFLNIYNKTSDRIDNDYGVSTKNAVEAFQKDQGLVADGEAGASTFSKMISWLKKQG